MSSGRCKALLGWYHENARQLPWRETRDPYRIWISEIMLQQTQVKTVLPRYLEWFELFPTIKTLATASIDDILKAWEGLGYYRRARMIHTAAQMIMDELNGAFPETVEEIMKLPGIGRSTAGAIAAFCFDANTPVLDGNVRRVLKRWHAVPEATDKKLWQLAQKAIDQSGSPAIWNQAMMELGATLCSARSADCKACPVKMQCASAFNVAVIQEKSKAVPVIDLFWRVELHTCIERGIWLEQRPANGIWGSLWSPPITTLDSEPDQQPVHIHQLTHRRLHLYPEQPDREPSGHGRWVKSIEGYALPTGILRLLEKIG